MKPGAFRMVAAIALALWLIIALAVVLFLVVGPYWFLFTVTVSVILIGWRREVVRNRERRADRAAEADAAVNHSEDCPRCAPARKRLQELDPLHGLSDHEFLDQVRERAHRVDVDDAGRWVRS